MKIFQGIPVSPGIVIGKAFVQEAEGFRIPEQFVDAGALESEIRRFQTAVDHARDEIAVNREATRGALGQTFADIFEAQIQLLLDPHILNDTEELIRSQRFSAEHAVTVVMGKHTNTLRRIENIYISEKINDLRDIEKRLLRHLLGEKKETIGMLRSPVILLATNLTPSETASLDKQFVQAIVTELGGQGGHTAILAAALEIPCIVGVRRFLGDVDGGDTLIVDGNSGSVIVRPDEEVLEKYRRIMVADSTRIECLDSFRDVEATTRDGTRISICANIEFPFEAENAVQRGAEGIGLFRTEFLYLTQKEDPTEEEHFTAYKHVVDQMAGKPVIIRTFDFGDDKTLDRYSTTIEHNPALGLRGIRLALKNWKLFRCQLRAILRASAFGDVRIMFPLVSTVKEFRQAKHTALRDAMEELREDKIAFNEEIPVGMMVEVPSAVVMLDKFAEDASFFSIGTNDLTQYTMAVDRGNSSVNHLFQADDPAILRLIRRTVDVATRYSIPVSLCGQMGTPQNIVLLLGLGLRNISCAPGAIARLKQICRYVSIEDCRAMARKALRISNAKDIRDYVQNKLKQIASEIFDSSEF
ncbi:MAG: phosphoenolpyruvate--protein phosphotransferase [Planctomycetaceae bacterium]|jgi:phosphotransferase system enzyme I (PtsI)|nr:phosphoenolpyruvate--protein phosphotransferase [Planctomycetaceae bacterium]